MRKNIFIAIALIFFTVFNCNAQPFIKHDVNISAGYGVGNIFKMYLKKSFSFPEYYSVKSVGPYCLLADYGISHKISAGIAIGYSITKGSANYQGFTFNEKLKAFSILARANFHPFRIKNFDPYIGGGAGYYHFKYLRENSPSDQHSVPGNFGYSGQLGARYYFVPHFSIYAEFGYIGGSLAQIGLSVKM